MKALSKQTAAPGLTLIDAPTPKPADGQVLIRVMATSLCGTDVHIYNWDEWAASRIAPPLVIGHECAGEVVELGKGVTELKVGDHIAVETHIPCGKCYQCHTGNRHLCQHLQIVGIDRPGSFAEYLSLPALCCVKQEKSLPWKLGAILEPLGNAVYTVDEGNVRGKTVAIFGDGPIGIFSCALARAAGAETVIALGMQPYRLDLMRTFSPDHVINVKDQNAEEAIMSVTTGHGVDVVLEMSGSARAIHDGFAVMKRAGTFVAFGIPSKPVEINFANDLIFKGATLKAINGRKMFETWDHMAELLSSKQIDVSHVITHEFPLENIAEAMSLLNAKEMKCGKIVLNV